MPNNNKVKPENKFPDKIEHSYKPENQPSSPPSSLPPIKPNSQSKGK